MRTAALALLLASALAAAAGSASAFEEVPDPCEGVWTLGGPDFFRADTSAIAKDCAQGERCEVSVHGVRYVLDGGAIPHVLYKSRPLYPDEFLPFDIKPTDTVQQTQDKVLDFQIPAGLGMCAGKTPVSVVAACDTLRGDNYLLQFTFDQAGHMTGVSETWLNGPYLYVEDPTFHMNGFKQPKKS